MIPELFLSAGKIFTKSKTDISQIIMDNNFEKCILCGGEKLEIREELPFQELQKIWQHGNIEIESHLSKEIFLLEECLDCGLQFFKPRPEGSGQFYSLFKNSDYYRLSWDYKKILKYILENNIDSVLDYGCGKGLFLKTLPKKVYRAGIDYNVENEKNENLELIKTKLLDFSSEKKYKGVVCVQVLEHLADIKRHLEKMSGLLDKNGYLFISVPDRKGILSRIENRGKCLDFPPHHLTRWSEQPLNKLAEIFNLRMINILKEPLSFQHFKWLKKMPVSIKYFGKSPWKKILRKTIFSIQDLYLPFVFPIFGKKTAGHSILAIFQK